MESIWKSEYSLSEITDPKNFKTYEELKKRLDDVLGLSTKHVKSITEEVLEKNLAKVKAERDNDDVPFTESKPVAKKAPVVEEEDEDLAMFRELADLND